MNSKTRQNAKREITEHDIQGLKYFKSLLPLLESLRDAGTRRDRAGNRRLHMDQYCAMILLSLFNPCVRTLRALKQASELRNVQRKLRCSSMSLGSLSEATEVFEPERLRRIIGDLAEQVRPIRRVGGEHLQQLLTAVDGTVIKTLSTVAKAAYLKDKNGRPHSAWRLHTHFDIDRHVPSRIDVTSARNSGKTDEKNVLRKQLASDHCYVMDRWYAEFVLFNDIVAAGSSYVCRVRDNSNLTQVQQERPVSREAQEANVVRDIVVNLGVGSKPDARPDHPVRVILVRATPHQKTGGRKGGTAGPPSDGMLRIATNLMDVPAEVIAEIFRNRWAVEIFFRFFKHILGCRHLISQNPVGVEIQSYCAIIACLLISLWTGRKPTLRTYEMICLYFQGWAEEDELLAHLEKLKRSPI